MGSRDKVEALWGALDQATSSISSFAIGILVARAVSRSELGAFSLAWAVYSFSLGASRALTSEPLAIRYTSRSKSVWEQATGAAGGASIVVGCLIGSVCFLVALGFDSPLRTSLMIVGLVLPGLLLQDLWRYAFFAAGRGPLAFLNDLFGAILLFTGLVLVMAYSSFSVEVMLLVWGVSMTAAGVLGMVQAAVRARPTLALRWFDNQADLAWRYLAEFAALAGYPAAVVITASVAGLPAAGALRAAQIALAPVAVVTVAASLFVIPQGVRLLKQSIKELHRRAQIVSLVLCVAAVAWGIVLFMLPEHAGTALLGRSWAAGRNVILPLTLGLAAVGVAMGPVFALRSMGAARHSLRARLLVSPLVILTAWLGAVVAQAPGAAVGIAAVNWLEAFVWWRALSKARSEHGMRDFDASDAYNNAARYS
jgi:O-antigen/teichoic acid export membrane protein